MLRRVGPPATAFLILVSSVAPAQESSPAISLRIAKTNGYVIAFGDVEGGRSVRVRLFRNGEAMSTKRVDVEEGSYRTRFPRPAKGSCLVKVRLRRSDARDEEEFPCYIPNFTQGNAVLTSPTSSTTVDALIADSNEERGYGLMYRPRMRVDLGMAFLYDHDTEGAFWMKNTLIPLSIAFFADNGTILRILDMEPCTGDPCPLYDPGVSYRGAFEVNQGAFDEWGVAEGDHIQVTETP